MLVRPTECLSAGECLFTCSAHAASREDHRLRTGETCQRRRVVSVRELQGITRSLTVCYLKSFTNHNTSRAALISVSLALNQTPAYTARPPMLVHRAVCLFTSSFRWYWLRLPTVGWPGWVELGGWLHTGPGVD